MKPYLVFLSSPNDVTTERDRAELVMKRLNAERVDHPQFEVIRWEHEWTKPGKPFIPPADYPAVSVVTTSTHDIEPIALW